MESPDTPGRFRGSDQRIAYDYSMRAFYDSGATLEGRTVSMIGFASAGEEGGWYLPRFLSSCCAADAAAIKAEVLDAPSPPIDQWVRMEGTFEPFPADASPYKLPMVRAVSVTEVEQPRDTYL